MSSISLSLAPSLWILLAKLCLRSAFVLAWPKFPPGTIVQRLLRLEMHRSILKMLALDEKYSICFDREFTFCSAHHVQHPWLIVQRFSLFSVEQNREWILNTCWDRAETIEFLLDFVKDEDKYFCFLHTESCKCVQRLLGRQISDNTLVFFWTLLFKKTPLLLQLRVSFWIKSTQC